jgi:uncharacterized DUF497 family protein
MQKFRWDEDKNIKLKLDRDIAFEDIVCAIKKGYLLDDIKHPKRVNQRILIVNINDYAHIVPYVQETKGTIFLKTIIPNRKATKKYLKSKK